ncbi:unnamed protein product [Lota lota]
MAGASSGAHSQTSRTKRVQEIRSKKLQRHDHRREQGTNEITPSRLEHVEERLCLAGDVPVTALIWIPDVLDPDWSTED